MHPLNTKKNDIKAKIFEILVVFFLQLRTFIGAIIKSLKLV